MSRAQHVAGVTVHYRSEQRVEFFISGPGSL